MLYRFMLGLLVLLSFCSPLHARTLPQWNQTAPPLTIQLLLNAPQGAAANWDFLHGRAVVLEFWATWCGGCVANIPHLNALSQKFRGQPMQFISITDEPRDIVSRFLKETPINGWVALDSNDATFKAYGVLGRPTIALIDSSGVLRAVTGAPSQVNESVLNQLIEGKALNFPAPSDEPPPLGMEPGAPVPLVQVLIRPAAPSSISGYSPGAEIPKGGRFDLWGIPLTEMLSDASDVPVERIEAPSWCNETLYDLTVTVPQGEAQQRWLLVMQVLEATFQLQVQREQRETSVYVLRTLPGQPSKLQPTTSASSSAWHKDGAYEFIDAKASALASIAQGRLRIPVFDETGLTSRYDFKLTMGPSNDEATIAHAFREQLGLELVPSQRKLDYLVVKSAVAPRTW